MWGYMDIGGGEIVVGGIGWEMLYFVWVNYVLLV